MADPPGDKFAMLQELQRRQQAILGGLQGQAMYPEVGEQPTDHDGIVEMSDAQPSNVGDFERDARVPDMRPVTTNRYRYKPEFQGAPGADAGEHEGPMAQDLEHIPGVVKPGPDGMRRVDPARLSMANASATGENSREIDQLRKRLAALEGGLSGSDEDALANAQSGRY